MKNSSLGTKLLMAVICLAVLAYFGIQAYHYYADPLTTTVAYQYQVEESSTVSGYVVRDEQVLSGESSGLLRLSRSEGEKVPKGGKVAVVYADQDSLDRQNQISTLQTQIEQLQYAQDAELGSAASLRLDSQITENLLKLRSEVTADRLDAAGDYIQQLRALVLKRDYTRANSGDAAAQLADLQAQLKTLQSKAASTTKTITAPVSGIYSAVVDGYETVLTPSFLQDLKPSSLVNIQPDSSVSSDLGKLILGDEWYYAATMEAGDADSLRAGQTLTLRFAKGSSRDLRVTVQSVSKKENGRVAVVFASTQYLSEVTLLRQQSADVIFSTVSGIRVPANAVRVNDEGQSGIYCVVGMVARFKPVKVVYSGDDYALVAADSEKESLRLRSGDEVIITANHLYDGKVVS